MAAASVEVMREHGTASIEVIMGMIKALSLSEGLSEPEAEALARDLSRGSPLGKPELLTEPPSPNPDLIAAAQRCLLKPKLKDASTDIRAAAAAEAAEEIGATPQEAACIAASVVKAAGGTAIESISSAGEAAAKAVSREGGCIKEAVEASKQACLLAGASRETAARLAGEIAAGLLDPSSSKDTVAFTVAENVLNAGGNMSS